VGCPPRRLNGARDESVADDCALARVVSAVEKLGGAKTQQTNMMAIKLSLMREKPMVAVFLAHRASKMLFAEGIKVPSFKAAADACCRWCGPRPQRRDRGSAIHARS